MKSLDPGIVKLVTLLNDGCHHDTASISQHLNATPAAVGEIIKKLEQYGVPVQFIKGKGYQLNPPLLLLDSEQIQRRLRHERVELTVLGEITSTNDYLSELTPQNNNRIACIAELQTAGKGRLRRAWHSPFAQNIYLSMAYPFDRGMSELGGLSLVVGLAICKAIEESANLRGKQLQLKWPNDILIEGCKLAGSLMEIEAGSSSTSQVIIGIGANINMQAASQDNIDQAWTSLSRETGLHYDRNIICAELIDTVIEYLTQFSETGLAGFVSEWEKRDALMNSKIAVLAGNKKHQGRCLGINRQGHLRMQLDSGETLTFSSGEATLLK